MPNQYSSVCSAFRLFMITCNSLWQPLNLSIECKDASSCYRCPFPALSLSLSLSIALFFAISRVVLGRLPVSLTSHLPHTLFGHWQPFCCCCCYFYYFYYYSCCCCACGCCHTHIMRHIRRSLLQAVLRLRSLESSEFYSIFLIRVFSLSSRNFLCFLCVAIMGRVCGTDAS